MTRLRILVCSTITVCLLPTFDVCGAKTDPKPLQTNRLGGVNNPSDTVLMAMHRGQYILHAQRGKLTKLPVERIQLPRDPGPISPQSIQASLTLDGTVYVTLATIVCKSTDGGRTWTSHKFGGSEGPLDILGDGTFIRVTGSGIRTDPVEVITSTDEGRSWKTISRIKLPPLYNERYLYRLYRLPDDTLILPIEGRRGDREWPAEGAIVTLSYRSTDQGKTWNYHGIVPEMGSEGGFAMLPSGEVLSVVRYQRPRRAGDQPGVDPRGYKHVFLSKSKDQGLTWTRLRQLCTVYGQTRGYPAALSDGTVVVIHDTRYGPGSPGSRAMVSHDEGTTWADEVYYMDSTKFTGSYNASVVLKDDLILSVLGSSQGGNSWEAVKNNTDFFAVRWRPVSRKERPNEAAPVE